MDTKKAILLNVNDNVAVVLSPVIKGDIVSIFFNKEVISTIIALDDIELYHKIAIKKIHNGKEVYKYGNVIGKATGDIEIGQHVHIHNIRSVKV